MKAFIVGVGLIGGSFALSLKNKGICSEVVGYDISADNVAEAVARGLIDRAVDMDEGVAGSDLIVLAAPVDKIPMMATKILNKVTSGQVVMDMGSTKGELCEVTSMHRNRGRLVATHPMWGTEYHGPQAAVADAFTGRKVVLCDIEHSDRDAVELVEGIYTRIGMPIVYMAPDEHDLHAAYVSHISHITSFALALTVLEKEREAQHIFDLAGGGFESTVRLAKSPASMWVPILMQNKYNVLDVLREHIHQLQIMRLMIERDDEKGLREAMQRANTIQKILG